MLSEPMTMPQPGTFEFYGGNNGAFYEGSMPTGNGLGSGEFITHPNTYADQMTAKRYIDFELFGDMEVVDDVEDTSWLATTYHELFGGMEVVDVGEDAPWLTTANPWNASLPSQTTPGEGQLSANGWDAMDTGGVAVTSRWTEFLKSLLTFDGYTCGEKFEPDMVFPSPSKFTVLEEQIEPFDFEYLPRPEN